MSMAESSKIAARRNEKAMNRRKLCQINSLVEINTDQYFFCNIIATQPLMRASPAAPKSKKAKTVDDQDLKQAVTNLLEDM